MGVPSSMDKTQIGPKFKVVGKHNAPVNSYLGIKSFHDAA
jgi:hypothetical protein